MMDVETDANGVDCGCVVIRHEGGWLLADSLIEPLPLTLFALVSDDPDSWDDMSLLWSRHSSPPVPECLSSVPFKPAEATQVRRSISADPFFLVIDLIQKVVATGPEYPRTLGAMRFVTDECGPGNKRYTIGIHIPDWWLVRENVHAEEAIATRTSDSLRPIVDRNFLYGASLAKAVATDLIKEFESYRGPATREIPHEILVRIHREWLVTPRSEPNVSCIRDLLHGSHAWIESVTTTQEYRFEEGLPIVALPERFASCIDSPMGRTEMVIYFDYCRMLIADGWARLDDAKANGRDVQASFDDLVVSLLRAGELWMETPLEGGCTPKFIVDCDRRRVPRGIGVPIVGMDSGEQATHPLNCDCPICEMMIAGHFGPMFSSICDYHLEFDSDFVFSAFETEEEWRENCELCGIDY